MKTRRILILIISICIFFTGCVSPNGPSNSKSDDSFEFTNQNFFSLDWQLLNQNISKRIQAKDNHISMPYMYDQSSMDILFNTEGDIMSFYFSLWAEEDSTKSDYIMGQYIIEDNGNITYPEAFSCDKSAITALNVHCREDGGRFEKTSFEKYFNFNLYIKNINWLNDFDFASVIRKYVKGNPARLQFLSGPIAKEAVNNPDVNITMLNCTSSEYKETERKCLPDSENPNLQFAMFEEKLDNYFVIVPYYVQDGSLKGFDEKTLGQNERITYIANNLIFFFVEE